MKVKTIILSHLSDAQEELSTGRTPTINTRLNFVKYLTLNYPDNTVVIDPDAVFEEFRAKHPNL